MKAIQALAIYLTASMNNSSFASAGSQDLCTKGSDAECSRFGSNMCCAHIQYTFKQDTQDFYACASRSGIEYSGNTIYDDNGFSGYWYCDQALVTSLSVVAISAVAAAFVV